MPSISFGASRAFTREMEIHGLQQRTSARIDDLLCELREKGVVIDQETGVVTFCPISGNRNEPS